MSLTLVTLMAALSADIPPPGLPAALRERASSLQVHQQEAQARFLGRMRFEFRVVDARGKVLRVSRVEEGEIFPLRGSFVIRTTHVDGKAVDEGQSLAAASRDLEALERSVRPGVAFPNLTDLEATCELRVQPGAPEGQQRFSVVPRPGVTPRGVAGRVEGTVEVDLATGQVVHLDGRWVAGGWPGYEPGSTITMTQIQVEGIWLPGKVVRRSPVRQGVKGLWSESVDTWWGYRRFTLGEVGLIPVKAK